MGYIEAKRADFGANNPYPPRDPPCTGPASTCGLKDSAVVIAARLDMIDLRHYLPERVTDTNGTDLLRFTRPVPASVIQSETVGGAICDGASACLVRLTPKLPGDIFDPTVEINDRDSAALMPERIYGGLRFVFDEQASPRPALPTLSTIPALPVATDPWVDGYRNLASIWFGTCVWVPPDGYIDPRQGGTTLEIGESTWLGFRLRIGGVYVGRRPFNLRRPPIVLVHGIIGHPTGTFSPSDWNEVPGNPVITRLYRVDWSDIGLDGYDIAYQRIRPIIGSAIEDYRIARDQDPEDTINIHHPLVGFRGVRHAATRVDAVGHSQGGQLWRRFIADTGVLPFNIPRGLPWNPITTLRSADPSAPNAEFSRPDNLWTGDVHRYISIGSPFNGSPIANVFEPYCIPTTDNIIAWTAAKDAHLLPADIKMALFHGTEFYDAPECVSDLAVNSPAQISLTAPIYPTGRRKIPWSPLVGIATISIANAPASGAVWELLFEMVPHVGGTPGQISPLNPGTSDLIVEAISQRNYGGGPGDPNGTIGTEFTYTAHCCMSTPLPQNETQNPAIITRIGELLSQPRIMFGNGDFSR